MKILSFEKNALKNYMKYWCMGMERCSLGATLMGPLTVLLTRRQPKSGL